MPSPELIRLGFMLALSACMVWVIVSDASKYIIPNQLNLLVVVLFAVGIFFLPIHPLSALCVAGIVLLIGLLIFALGIMGGGDVKLLVAVSLWTGWWIPTLNFLFLTAVAGGLLVVLVLLARSILPPLIFGANPTKPIPRILQRKQPVPYGLAIAGAFLFMIWMPKMLPVLN